MLKKQNTYNNLRSSNIELLRIISMLLIVCNHCEGHALHIQGFDTDAANLFSNWLLRGIGYIGVNVYVLISSFFLCRGKFKLKKLVYLIAEVWFYSIIIYASFLLTGKISFSYKGFVYAFLPTLCSQYWFITCYVILYLFAPFFNRMIAALFANNVLLKFTLIVLVVFCIIPNVFFFSEWVHFGGTCGIVWMCCLYLIGSTIRYYIDIPSLKNKRIWIWSGMALCWVLPLLSKMAIAYITQIVCGHIVGSSLFYMNNSIIIVASSIFTFLAFLTIDIGNKTISSIINFIAPSSLAVYLLHDNIYIRPLLWEGVSYLWGGVLYPPSYKIILIGVAIFFLCAVIDLLRRFVFNVFSFVFETKAIKTLINRVDNILA